MAYLVSWFLVKLEHPDAKEIAFYLKSVSREEWKHIEQ